MNVPPPKAEILLAPLLLPCVSATTTAQGADDCPANWRRKGLFPSDDAGFKLAKVGGSWTGRVNSQAEAWRFDGRRYVRAPPTGR